MFSENKIELSESPHYSLKCVYGRSGVDAHASHTRRVLSPRSLTGWSFTSMVLRTNSNLDGSKPIGNIVPNILDAIALRLETAFPYNISTGYQMAICECAWHEDTLSLPVVRMSCTTYEELSRRAAQISTEIANDAISSLIATAPTRVRTSYRFVGRVSRRMYSEPCYERAVEGPDLPRVRWPVVSATHAPFTSGSELEGQIPAAYSREPCRGLGRLWEQSALTARQ